MSATTALWSRCAALDGGRAMAPMAIGLVPFGIAVGAAISRSGVDPWAGWAGSFLLFGGSAQLAVVGMLARDAPPLMIVATALVINLRFVAYGAGLARLVPTASRAAKAAAAATLVDQTFLISTSDAESHERSDGERLAFYFGASALVGVCWILSQTIGILAGGALPVGLHLEAAAVLSLGGLAARATKVRSGLLAAGGAAAATAVLSNFAGPGTMVLGIAAGVVAGSLFERSAS